MSIAENIERIRAEIGEAAVRTGRRPESVLLLGVTKTVPAERIAEAYACGLKTYGENHVQEYVAKKDELPQDAVWHIIGRLQSNKVKYVAGRVELVHSLCTMSTAAEMQKVCLKRDSVQDCLIEVNVTGEESKDGVPAAEVREFLKEISGFDRVKVRGLMTIGRLSPDPEVARDCFRRAKALFEELKDENAGPYEMKWLSMGMSADYKIAVEEGADIVRVGSAIFGRRE